MDWIRKSISAGKRKIQSYQLGEGEETILLIHDGSEQTRKAHEFLPKAGYRLITCDPVHLAEEIKEIKTQLNIKYPHILGTSWGGMLAIEYLMHYPDSAKSLILVNSAASSKHIDIDLPKELHAWERLYHLHLFEKPAFLIHGEHFHPQIAEVTQSYLPNSRFEILKGTLLPFLEDPISYQKVLLNFLNSI